MGLVRATGSLLLIVASLRAADMPVTILRVCDLLSHLAAYKGQTVALVGRFSFRDTGGRFLSEQTCDQKLNTGEFVWPNAVRLSYDPKSGPKAPENFEIDAASVQQQLKLVKQTTSLGKFRFGTPDYDRWAVVYGRVEISPDFSRATAPPNARKNALEPPPALLIYRGDALIVFVADP